MPFDGTTANDLVPLHIKILMLAQKSIASEQDWAKRKYSTLGISLRRGVYIRRCAVGAVNWATMQLGATHQDYITAIAALRNTVISSRYIPPNRKYAIVEYANDNSTHEQVMNIFNATLNQAFLELAEECC